MGKSSKAGGKGGEAPANADQVGHKDDDASVALEQPWVAAALFGLTVVLYLNSLKGQFVFDDTVAVVKNKACCAAAAYGYCSSYSSGHRLIPVKLI